MQLLLPPVVLRIGLRSIAAHRLRSILTVLGVILGGASIIVMLGIAEAARVQAVQQIQELGATNIIVRSVKPAEDSRQQEAEGVLEYGLTLLDVERIVSTIPTVNALVAVRESRKKLRCLDRHLEGQVMAVTPKFFETAKLRLSRGRFFNDVDDKRLATVAVLGSGVAETLFPFQDPIGQCVEVDSRQFYTVIGVVQSRGPSAGFAQGLSKRDFNNDVYIPFGTDRARFGELVTYERAGTWQIEKLEISQLTVAVRDMEHVKPTARIIRELLSQFHVQEDTELTVPLDLLERAEKTQRLFAAVLAGIASTSLVVGGIGIMNIMLATVTERTREIGIRRAVGATRWAITWQFLVEALALSTLGGLLGVLMGVSSCYGITRLFELQTIVRFWSPLSALAFSVLVGLLFGTYPAYRAAQLDPIEALRHD